MMAARMPAAMIHAPRMLYGLSAWMNRRTYSVDKGNRRIVSNMPVSLSKLFSKHDLSDAVPYLEAEGVTSLERLRMVEESHVDKIATRHNIPLMTVELLNSKIKSKVLVNEFEKILLMENVKTSKARQVHTRIHFHYFYCLRTPM